MVTDYKSILRDIVELFYQPPFKIFNVNSIDGVTFVRPIGYFISLGITTSFDSLRNIKELISRSDYGFDAKLVELKSVKSEDYGDYLNTLSNIPESEIKKYPSSPPSNIQVFTKEEAEEMLKELSEKIDQGDYSVTTMRNKLQDTIEKIDDWENHGIQLKGGVYGVFHKFVNYRRTDDIEYRIGIYVTKI